MDNEIKIKRKLKMKVKITYIYHSCFTLTFDEKVLIFDYPGRGVKRDTKERLISQIKGSDLYAFVSHAHGDHFTPDVTGFSSHADRSHFIVSQDVHLKRSSIGGSDSLTKVRPGRAYQLNDLEVETFESNDAGVAFLLKHEGMTVYYGGDLAKWNWPEWSKDKRDKHVKVFEEVTDSLQKEEVDIAFSNMDERLPSWGGPIEFIEKVGPTYFVPMHTFGSEEWIEDLIEKGWKTSTEVFDYRGQSEQMICEV